MYGIFPVEFADSVSDMKLLFTIDKLSFIVNLPTQERELHVSLAAGALVPMWPTWLKCEAAYRYFPTTFEDPGQMLGELSEMVRIARPRLIRRAPVLL